MKDTKEIILKTAYNLFLYNNYEAVTISKIIQATGLTKGAIYYYYTCKEEIFKAVVDKYMLENHPDSSVEYSSLKELIQHTIELVKSKSTKMALQNPSFENNIPVDFLSLVVAAFHYYPGFSKIGYTYFNNEMEKWEKALKKGIGNNEIRKDVDIEAMVSSFLQVGSAIVGNMIMGGNMMYALEMVERQYWELYKYIKK
jgi:AcrR family transcriptional regulator